MSSEWPESDYRVFPDSLAVRTLHFCCWGLGSIHGWRTKIPQAIRYGKKQTNKKQPRPDITIIFTILPKKKYLGVKHKWERPVQWKLQNMLKEVNWLENLWKHQYYSKHSTDQCSRCQNLDFFFLSFELKFSYYPRFKLFFSALLQIFFATGKKKKKKFVVVY